MLTDQGQWKKATFFFNIDNDEQVFGLERKNKVGLPNPILSALIKYANASTEGNPFKIDGYALTKKGSFRESVGAYPGPITSIKFELVIPNPIDSEGKTKEALKNLRDKTNADKLKETILSSEGLKTDSEYITDLVEYSEAGGGAVVAKSGSDLVYDSKKIVRTAEVDESLRPTGRPIDGIADSVKSKWVR